MDFDPYRQWLSLDDEPSNFYGLLGLQPLESDTDLIQSAASQVISRVRNVQPGTQIGAWKQLLDQIEQARDALCDPVKKQIYDQGLRNEVGTRDVSLSVSNSRSRSDQLPVMAKHVPDPMSPLDDADLPGHAPEAPQPKEPAEPSPAIQRSRFLPRRTRARRPRVRRNRPWAKPVALFIGAVAFLSVAFALWLVLQSNQQLLSFVFKGQPNSPNIQDNVENPPAPIRQVPTVTVESPDSSIREKPTPFGTFKGDENAPIQTDDEQPPTVVKTVEPVNLPMKTDRPSGTDVGEEVPLTKEQLRQFGQSLKIARQALSEQKFDESKQQLAAARQLARTPERRAKVERLDTLHQYVHGFWMAVEDGMVDLENSELVMNGNRMFVVEVNPRQIILRVEGRNRRIDRDRLPTKLAIAIADRWFDQNASSTKVFKGALMAVTPGYSDQQVRQLWQQAQLEGTDLGDLMQVLDD